MTAKSSRSCQSPYRSHRTQLWRRAGRGRHRGRQRSARRTGPWCRPGIVLHRGQCAGLRRRRASDNQSSIFTNPRWSSQHRLMHPSCCVGAGDERFAREPQPPPRGEAGNVCMQGSSAVSGGASAVNSGATHLATDCMAGFGGEYRRIRLWLRGSLSHACGTASVELGSKPTAFACEIRCGAGRGCPHAQIPAVRNRIVRVGGVDIDGHTSGPGHSAGYNLD